MRGFSFLSGEGWLVLLLLNAGCNSQVATYPVSGTVRFQDGQPVPYGNIEFRNEESGLSARGTLNPTGAFRLGTFSADDGAPSGNYRAIVIQYFNAQPDTAHVRIDAVHGAHGTGTDVRVAAEVSDFSTSPLRAEVRADKQNQFDFTVRRFVSPRPTTSRRERPVSAIERDVRAALRAEALSRRLGENAPDVIRLVDLYHELAAHPKRNDSTLLRQLGLQLRSRLKTVRDHVERQLSNPDRRIRRTEMRPALMAPEIPVLAQQLGGARGAALGQGAQPAAIRPGLARTIDYGPDLVELIQQTISSETWDINGGNGSVVYFAPLRVLVVSAPDTVHTQVSDVLGQLRAAP